MIAIEWLYAVPLAVGVGFFFLLNGYFQELPQDGDRPESAAFSESLSPQMFWLLTAPPANEERCVLTTAKAILAEVISTRPKVSQPLGASRTAGGPATSCRFLNRRNHE